MAASASITCSTAWFSAAAAARLARAYPASYMVFDILAVDGHDVRGLPWRNRRELLEELAENFMPPIQLSPATEDRAVATVTGYSKVCR